MRQMVTSSVLLKGAFGFNEDGTATVFVGNQKKRKQVLEEKYSRVSLKNSDLTILNSEG